MSPRPPGPELVCQMLSPCLLCLLLVVGSNVADERIGVRKWPYVSDVQSSTLVYAFYALKRLVALPAMEYFCFVYCNPDVAVRFCEVELRCLLLELCDAARSLVS